MDKIGPKLVILKKIVTVYFPQMPCCMGWSAKLSQIPKLKKRWGWFVINFLTEEWYHVCTHLNLAPWRFLCVSLCQFKCVTFIYLKHFNSTSDSRHGMGVQSLGILRFQGLNIKNQWHQLIFNLFFYQLEIIKNVS